MLGKCTQTNMSKHLYFKHQLQLKELQALDQYDPAYPSKGARQAGAELQTASARILSKSLEPQTKAEEGLWVQVRLPRWGSMSVEDVLVRRRL